MSPKDNAARRSAARERRRADLGNEPESNGAEESTGSETALQAAKGAAAAAALGAAVGAVRVLTSRPSEAEPGEESPETEASHDGDGSTEHAPENDSVERTPERETAQEPEHEDRPRPRRARNGAAPETVRSIAGRARELLRDLQAREPESISSLEQTGEGWCVTFEIVEVDRVPSSTDVLATYLVELDKDGELMRFERVRRYYRAQADRGGVG